MDIMSYESVRMRCIRILNNDGQSHVVSVQNLLDAPSIKKRIAEKFNIEELEFQIFTMDARQQNLRAIDDKELVDICHSKPPREEKDKLILQVTTIDRKPSRKLRRRYQRIKEQSVVSSECECVVRPPCDLISMNFDAFFPSVTATESEISTVGSDGSLPPKLDQKNMATIQYLVKRRLTRTRRTKRRPFSKASLDSR